MNNFPVNEFIADLHHKHFFKNFLTFLAGVFISSLALNLFYKRYNVVVSGSGGLAVLLDKYISLDVSIILLIINLICLIIGLIFFHWNYALKMLMITFISPLFVKLTLYITNLIDLEDTSLFLVMIVGGGLSGYANGLIRNSGYSPGGFYPIYEIMHKYLHMSIGSANTIINAILIFFGGLVFGFDKALYAIISLLLASDIVDKVTLGVSNNKVFYIVSEKPLEVQEYINNKLNYDVTLVNARGGYSNKKKRMLMSVISTRDYVSLKELVLEIDNKAFFLIVDTYESSVKKKCKSLGI